MYIERMVNGQCVSTRREISLDLWCRVKFSSAMFDSEINAMLREVG
jgi:hypothetical protein